ncbi:L-aspartate oxidase [Chloroflexia bacterium SDU3-3]|nr:L-aspartate oxidase [Chloroflexia bacterium SDU3-3]
MYDYIIIGSGIAGLYTALRAAQHGSVLVLTKSKLEESNTRYAQGGIAAAFSPEDSPALHYEDTLIAGAGLCDEAAVRVLTDEAPARIRDLFSYQVPFDRHDGEVSLGLEGAHSRRRILHAGGDATGWHIEEALCQAIRKANVAVLEDAFVTEIAVEHGRATGVWAMQGERPARRYRGRHIILASGGAGQLYAYTTNPGVATGSGMALAFRAGAELIDLEFYQFHPTALRMDGLPPFLISEAVRGEGAYLRNSLGERFMPRYDERNELAPRDIVARAITSEMRRTGSDCAYLDLRHLDAEEALRHFPTIAKFCAEAGMDITKDLVPVAPAAHYMMGGVRTNSWGETSLPGLYACGEVACSGVHGANRLASNSLLEGLVFGGRIVERTLQRGAAWFEDTESADFGPDQVLELAQPQHAAPSKAPTQADLQRLMWQNVGLVREAAELEEAVETMGRWQAALAHPRSIADHELRNQVLLGWLMAQAALARQESRGGHFRSDAPETLDAWRHRIVVGQRVAVEHALERSLAAAD